MRPARSQPLTVLLVEPDDLLRRSLGRHLVAYGNQVLIARDAASAILAWDQSPVNIDVLLVSVLLPGMGGPVLARRFRARSPHLITLYLTHYDPEALIAQGVLEPDAICVPSSCSPELLARLLHRSLAPPKGGAMSA
jgi:CheY-like chemotaxis protein